MHAQLAHVAERHRRTDGVAGFHFSSPAIRSAAVTSTGSSVLLGAVMLIAMFAGGTALLWGTTWVSENLIGPALTLSGWALTICVLVLLPLSILRVTRTVAIWGFFVASFIFGAAVWMLGFDTLLFYWGGVGVFIGVFVFGVGVVPFGILATLINADWTAVAMLVIGLALTIGCRVLSFWLEDVQDRVKERRAAKRTAREEKLPAGVAAVFD